MTAAAARERALPCEQMYPGTWSDRDKTYCPVHDKLTDALAAERERTRQLEGMLTLARRQFAWIAREATGDNDQGRIIHAAQRGQDAIDALDGAEES